MVRKCIVVIVALCGVLSVSSFVFAQSLTDPRCFTLAECVDGSDKGGHDGIWDGVDTDECASGYRFCYAKDETLSITLGVPIGNLKTARDLEEYLSFGYTWLLSAAVTIAVVLVMIGGLQYALGPAGGSQISQAKRRIQNAVVGLVLLLGAVLIVQTINPQLLNLTVPSLPLIKRIVTVDGASCEAFLAQGYTLESTSGVCGDESKVIKDDEGNAIADGTLCAWSKCSGFLERCMVVAGKAQCVECTDVVEGEQGVGLSPSSSVCNQFQYGKQTQEGAPVQRYCGWTKDSDLNPGINVKSLRHGSCAYFTIDCSQIDECEDYDDIVASNRISSQPLEDIILETDPLCGITGGCGNFGLKQICLANPCSALNGGRVVETCVYDGAYDCD